MPICICLSCSDTPLCTAQDVCYLPGPESVARMELWHEMAVAKVLVENISSLASCRKYIKLVLPVHRQLAHAPGRPVLVHCTHILVYLSLFLYTFACTTPVHELKNVHVQLYTHSRTENCTSTPANVQCTCTLYTCPQATSIRVRQEDEGEVRELGPRPDGRRPQHHRGDHQGSQDVHQLRPRVECLWPSSGEDTHQR